MKKILAASLIASLLPMAALAGGNHPMAGCGLVYMLGVQDNSSTGLQTLASTFNNFYGTQSFGITSGTSGCTPDGQLALNKETEVFIEVNLDQIRYEMAKGQGAYLDALAAMMGAGQQQVPSVVEFLQSNYETLFPTDTVSAQEFMDSLSATLEAHPNLLS